MATGLGLGSVAVDRREVLSRRIRFLVAATIACNLIEAVVAITAGTIARSRRARTHLVVCISFA